MTHVGIDWAAITRLNRTQIKKGELKVGDRDSFGQPYEKWSSDLLEYFRQHKWPLDKKKQDVFAQKHKRRKKPNIASTYTKKRRAPLKTKETSAQPIKTDSHKIPAKPWQSDPVPPHVVLSAVPAIVLRSRTDAASPAVSSLALGPALFERDETVVPTVEQMVAQDDDIWSLLHTIDSNSSVAPTENWLTFHQVSSIADPAVSELLQANSNE